MNLVTDKAQKKVFEDFQKQQIIMQQDLKQLVSKLTNIESKLDTILKLNIQSKLDTILKLLKEENIENDDSDKEKKEKKSKPKKKKKSKPKQPIKRGNANVTIYDDAVLITGNTYDRKDYIKSFKARWNAEFKGWTLSVDNYEKMKENIEDYFNSVDYNLLKNKNLLKVEEEVSVNNYEFLSDDNCAILSDSD